MKFETKARPITTAEELEAAITADARIEFTACGDPYDMPPHDEPGSAGWIIPISLSAHGRALRNGLVHEDWRYRAFYPERRSLLSRLAFWRKAA